MNRNLMVEDCAVGPFERTLVVAEIGVNHDGRLDRALALVRHAAEAGADAVKLQVFRAETLMHRSAGFAAYQSERVSVATPADMLRRLELPPTELATVVAAVRHAGLIPLATPFSVSDVGVIESLDLPAIKIASPDLVNRPLLRRCAQTHRPLLVSTGAATLDEIDAAVSWLCEWGARFALLHCVSAYPVESQSANLCWISELSARYRVPVGYSDHTVDLLAGALAVGHGACVIEKHLTYDRNASGPDHAASADPRQFAEYISMVRTAEQLRGRPGRHVLDCERDVRTVSRQSLVLRRDIPAGSQISSDDLDVQRPGTGIPASEESAVVGRIVRSSLPAGTLLRWEMLCDAA
jgi:sialic acid synthase SpsE